jgi:hypothetical protein
MAHLIDRCDILDLLEESATTGRALRVEVEGKQEFIDRVRDVVTADGEDYAEFRQHGRLSVSEIRHCARAEVIEQR